MERRLTAIFAADMVGYSRLMEVDEVGTLARQKIHRAELIDPRIDAHGGRIIKLTGDGMIAEFPSVVEAVQCAVSVQQDMIAREAEVPEAQKIRYRIAINLGDVIFDEGDVYGDGVNIAARLETLAEPGGIVVSGTAYDHLKSNVEVGYEDLGEQLVKNIATPVRVYRVMPDASGVIKRRPTSRTSKIMAAAVAVALCAGLTGWWLSNSEPISADRTVTDPTRTRVAVLPFDYFGDEGKDWFADGLTEDLITRLSAFEDLAVIARNSTFQYKGKATDIREIADELQADYVVEGSIRRAGETLRVTAQLLNANDAAHVWAETYDRSLSAENLFAIQDEITLRIAASIGGRAGEITAVGNEDLNRKTQADLNAYDCVLVAMRVMRTIDAVMHAKATECLESTLKENPDYAMGWTYAAHMAQIEATYGFNPQADPVGRMLVAAQKAVELDPDSAYGHQALGLSWFNANNKSKSVVAFKRAVELNPNDADLLGTAGFYLVHLGELDDGKQLIDSALALTPNPPYWFYYGLFHYNFQIGAFEHAHDAIDRIGSSPGAYWQYLFGAVALVRMERIDEAAELIARARQVEPNLDEVVPPVADLWWWALPDEGNGYMDALATVGVNMR